MLSRAEWILCSLYQCKAGQFVELSGRTVLEVRAEFHLDSSSYLSCHCKAERKLGTPKTKRMYAGYVILSCMMCLEIAEGEIPFG